MRSCQPHPIYIYFLYYFQIWRILRLVCLVLNTHISAFIIGETEILLTFSCTTGCSLCFLGNNNCKTVFMNSVWAAVSENDAVSSVGGHPPPSHLSRSSVLHRCLQCCSSSCRWQQHATSRRLRLTHVWS